MLPARQVNIAFLRKSTTPVVEKLNFLSLKFITMNLKKKVIFTIATGLFAVATVFNMSILNENGAGDVSLGDIALMAQAGGESGSGDSCPDGRWETIHNTGNWSECDGDDYVEYSNGGSFDICTTTGAIKNDNTYYIVPARIVETD